METGIRVVVYVPQEQHRKLKGKLSLEGKTVSEWFRDKISQELITKTSDLDKSFYIKADPSLTDTANTIGYVEGKALAYASKPFVRCRAPMCRNEATETGLAFNEQTGEMDEVPLCKKHADKAAKE